MVCFYFSYNNDLWSNGIKCAVLLEDKFTGFAMLWNCATCFLDYSTDHDKDNTR